MTARAFATHPFDAVTERELRIRQSAKWQQYPADVLPAWIAEMDVPLAAPITQALHATIDANDSGYAHARGLGDAFAAWSERHYGWKVAPGDVSLAPDVTTAIAEILRVTTEPGDGVVIEPPVYPPFALGVKMVGRKIVEAPLTRAGGSFAFDLDALARAYASGAKAHLLCSPHNPSGIVPDRATLAAIGELAAAHGVFVLSDEIHAPLTLPGAKHVPFPTASEAAASCSIVLTSASKAFNLAGLKAALIVASSERARDAVRKLPWDLHFHASLMGVVASRAAFTSGDEWLASTRVFLDRNRQLLAELLRESLPEIRYEMPQAGYLAWLDCAGLADRLVAVGGSAHDPAKTFLERGKVALSAGPPFGRGGEGCARLNIATPRALLEEAVRRMARSLER